MIVIATIVFNGLMTGCVEKDVYNPDAGKQPLPDPDEYFGFETRGDVKLLVNYDVPGFTALVEVYDEDPMETVEGTPVKKEGVEAIFKTYTDNNGKYEGKMHIPTSVETVYLYTAAWGLPRCVKREIKDSMVAFDMSVNAYHPETRSVNTRSYTFTGKVPYAINERAHLYSLCKWGWLGNLDFDERGESFKQNYLTAIEQVGNEKIGTFVQRIQNIFNPEKKPNVDNSGWVKESNVTNITVKQDNTSLDVVFINRDAEYNNTFGYYYYKTSEGVDVSTVRKYIIFPDVAIAPSHLSEYVRILKCGDKVRLLYFDDKGNANQSFPAGYTVGWFIYANGYNYNEGAAPMSNADEINTSKPLLTSNLKKGDKQSFITVNDKTSGKVIIGVEDGVNKSYCDLLFYVDATPEGSIDDPDRPVINPDDGKDDPEPDPVEPLKGTLAFEDIWPSGGDYDMNDVIVEYRREVSFNTENMVTKITDIFTPVHDGAAFLNAFAYQIDPGQLGKVTSTDVKVESETSSIIVTPNAKESIGKTYTITREFNASFKKDDLKGYNPYIIVKYADGQKDRTEVHLPKYKATSLANQSLIGTNKDAYYIDREGAYPFAIDIPVLGFKPVTERQRIDSEYPDFTKWAESKGAKYTDWYENYTGPRK